MKLTKRLSLILALAMVLSLAALASGEPSGGASGGASEEAVSIDGGNIETDDAYFTGTVTENGVRDFTVSAEGKQVIGLAIGGDPSGEPVLVENGLIRLDKRGTGISLTGGRSVIDNVVVWNNATEGVSASGNAVATLKNVVIYGAQDIGSYHRVSPFALGLAGSMRVTNAVGQSQVTYEDSLVVSGSWAPLSTDAGMGVTLTTRNVLAGVGWLEIAQPGKEYTAVKEVGGVTYGFTLGDSAHYNSGYVSYCDSGFHNYYYDSEFYGTDYVIILSSSVSSATLVNDKCYSDRIGIMWHKNQGGTVDITGGSLYADRCLFMMKGYSDLDTDGCHPNLIVDGTDLSVGPENVLLQVMTSDDCGLNYEALQVPVEEDDLGGVSCLMGTMVQKTYTEGFPPTVMYVFDQNGQEVGVSKADYAAFTVANPAARPVMVEYEPQQDCTALFKNLTVSGDIYNASWQAYQGLDVTFDNAQITGVISASQARHVDGDGNVLPGGTVIPADSSLDCHLGMGRLKNTAAPTINDPVYLTLENGAVWNVTGTSYLKRLTVTRAAVNGTVTVDGVPVDTSLGGTWEGEIVVSPAAGSVTWGDYQAWLISILPEVCPFPEEVGKIILATNSWEEIDMAGGPWGKIFGEDAFACTPWAEFRDNGGVGTYNADFVDLPAADAPASGEAS